MELLAGAVLARTPGTKYTAALHYAELAPSSPLPKASTLKRWRDRLPEGFQLALRAPDACWHPPEGPLRPSGGLDRGLAWLSDACDALRPAVVVVATGAAVTTGARDRQRLCEYFRRVPRSDAWVVAWQPRGLWEPELRYQMANTLEVTPGFDPIDDPVPEVDTLYASLQAEGLRRSFSEAQLMEIVDKAAVSGASRAYVSIDSDHALREAQLLSTLSAGRT